MAPHRVKSMAPVEFAVTLGEGRWRSDRKGIGLGPITAEGGCAAGQGHTFGLRLPDEGWGGILMAMITDSIQNVASYMGLSAHMAAALKFIVRPDLGAMALGKHVLDGDQVFAIIQEYQTKPEEACFWEAHRKYIDVQFIQTGVEAMGWAPIQEMKVQKEYDAGRDVVILEGKGQVMEVTGGHFAIFLPQDAHMPCLASGGRPGPVRKVVVKVAAG
jgi:biofilm protein TabA